MINSILVLKAAQFAALKHRDQRRKDVESSPYIIHPISVALAIAEVGGIEEQEILAAALLHDTLYAGIRDDEMIGWNNWTCIMAIGVRLDGC